MILSESLFISNFNFAVAVHEPCIDSKRANNIQLPMSKFLFKTYFWT